MIVYVVNIRSFTIKKNQAQKKVFPIDTPKIDSDIIVKISNTFPQAFEFWEFKSKDIQNKTKTAVFKTISKMFKYFDDNNIKVGVSLVSFYKKRNESNDEPPLEGELIYSYRNITIHRLRIG